MVLLLCPIRDSCWTSVYLNIPLQPSCSVGDVVGSSCGLLDELIDLASSLGIRLEKDDSLSQQEAARLYVISSGAEHPYANEICAWLTLHEACELSMTYGTAIVFVQA